MKPRLTPSQTIIYPNLYPQLIFFLSTQCLRKINNPKDSLPLVSSPLRDLTLSPRFRLNRLTIWTMLFSKTHRLSFKTVPVVNSPVYPSCYCAFFVKHRRKF